MPTEAEMRKWSKDYLEREYYIAFLLGAVPGTTPDPNPQPGTPGVYTATYGATY